MWRHLNVGRMRDGLPLLCFLVLWFLAVVGHVHYPGYRGCLAFSRAGCARNRSLIFMYSRYGGRFDVHLNGSGVGTPRGRRHPSRTRFGRTFNDVAIVRGIFNFGRMLPLRRNSGVVNQHYIKGIVSIPVRASSVDVSQHRYVVGMGHGGRKILVCALHSTPDLAKAFLGGRVLNSGSHVHVRSKTVMAVNTAAFVLQTTRRRDL